MSKSSAWAIGHFGLYFEISAQNIAMITETGSDKQTAVESQEAQSPRLNAEAEETLTGQVRQVPPAVFPLSLRSQQKVGPRWARMCRCWACPGGGLGGGEQGPLMAASPGRRASEGEAGGTILCLLSPRGLLQVIDPRRFQLCVGDLHPQLQLWSGRNSDWSVH